MLLTSLIKQSLRAKSAVEGVACTEDRVALSRTGHRMSHCLALQLTECSEAADRHWQLLSFVCICAQ